jgi:hypothetical protein
MLDWFQDISRVRPERPRRNQCVRVMLRHMAKITRSDRKAATCEGEPIFSSDLDGFSIGLSARKTEVTYHLHLTLEEARQLAAYVLAHDKVLPEVEIRPN